MIVFIKLSAKFPFFLTTDLILLATLHVLATIKKVPQDITEVKKFTKETSSKARNIYQNIIKLKEDHSKTQGEHVLHSSSFLNQFLY